MRALLATNAAFRRLWLAHAISSLGDWLLEVSVPFFVLVKFGGPAAAMLIGFRILARIVATMTLGRILDRSNRWRAIVWSYLVSLLAVGGLLTFINEVNRWAIIALVSVESGAAICAVGSHIPAAAQVVAPEKLLMANQALGGAEGLAQIVGPAAGGIIQAAAGVRWLLAIDMATFVLAVVVIGASAEFKRSVTVAVDSSSQLDHLKAGIRAIRSSPMLKIVVRAGSLISFAVGIMWAGILPYAKEQLGFGSTGLGVIAASIGIGGLVGLAFTPWASADHRRPAVLCLGAACSGAVVAAVAAKPVWWPVLVLTLFIGTISSVVILIGRLVLQTTADPSMLSQITMAVVTITEGSFAVGSLGGSWGLTAYTGRTVVALGGAAVFVMAIAVLPRPYTKTRLEAVPASL